MYVQYVCPFFIFVFRLVTGERIAVEYLLEQTNRGDLLAPSQASISEIPLLVLEEEEEEETEEDDAISMPAISMPAISMPAISMPASVTEVNNIQ